MHGVMVSVIEMALVIALVMVKAMGEPEYGDVYVYVYVYVYECEIEELA